MEPAFSLNIGSVGFIWRVKSPNLLTTTVNMNARHKPSGFLVRHNAEKPSLVIDVAPYLVLLIQGARDLAQVVNAVVRFLVVLVVDVSRWPNTMHVRPSDLMHVHSQSGGSRAYAQLEIAARSSVARWLANIFPCAPCKAASFRVVEEKIAQKAGAEFVFGHKYVL